MNCGDVLRDPQHSARGFFHKIDYPEAGDPLTYTGAAWKASERPERQLTAPPILGGDNEYVYRELLGFSEEEYQHFEELGHIGLEYAASVP